jgi:hypothetical protein
MAPSPVLSEKENSAYTKHPNVAEAKNYPQQKNSRPEYVLIFSRPRSMHGEEKPLWGVVLFEL